jgi:transposase
METLTQKKRRWIINQFKSGRSATSIARIQKISRQYVYKLVRKHKKEGIGAYEAKKSGRPKLPLNPKFVKKVVEVRRRHDYGSQKIHFVMKNEGFIVSQRQIQGILDEQGLTDPCPKRRGQRKYVRYQWPCLTTCGIVTGVFMRINGILLT